MLKLIIEDDEGKQTAVPLIRDEITIGRKEGNTIRLTERNISRRHARLSKQNGTVYVEDLGSYVGVKLNGVRISARSPIGDNDLVLIGDYRLHVAYDRPAVGTAPTAPAIPAAAPGQAGPRGTVLGVAGTDAAGAGGSAVEKTTNPILPRLTQSGVRAGLPGEAPVPPPIAAPVAPVPAPFAGAAPGAPVPMDGQPTIPVRSLDALAMAPSPVVAPALAGRLVVVSNDLGGREFTLDRPSVVIGRTDENDFVLNHRSISRHHAKVVRDGDRYTVVDLQSANGVRVNGEEYERVDLKPGDVLELGHLKIRFVGPGESFFYEGPVAGTGGGFPTKPVVFVAAGLVLAAALFFFLKPSGEKPQSKLVEVGKPAEPTKAAPAAAPAAATPAAEPAKPAIAGATAGEQLKAAEALAKEGKWAEALAAVEAVLAKEPALAEAQELRARYDGEAKNAGHYETFTTAVEAKNLDEAVLAYTQITEGSAYKDQGKAAFAKVRGRFIEAHLGEAEKLRGQGRCTEVQEHADMVLTVDDKNREAREVVKLCRPKRDKEEAPAKEPTAVAEAPSRSSSHKSSASAPREKAPKETLAPKALASAAAPKAAAREPEAAAGGGGGNPVELVTQARSAWIKGQHAAAIEAARKALRAKPGFSDAYVIIAVASCSLKDADGAGRAYAKLDDKLKSMARSHCSKNGITLE